MATFFSSPDDHRLASCQVPQPRASHPQRGPVGSSQEVSQEVSVVPVSGELPQVTVDFGVVDLPFSQVAVLVL